MEPKDTASSQQTAKHGTSIDTELLIYRYLISNCQKEASISWYALFLRVTTLGNMFSFLPLAYNNSSKA